MWLTRSTRERLRGTGLASSMILVVGCTFGDIASHEAPGRGAASHAPPDSQYTLARVLNLDRPGLWYANAGGEPWQVHQVTRIDRRRTMHSARRIPTRACMVFRHSPAPLLMVICLPDGSDSTSADGTNDAGHGVADSSDLQITALSGRTMDDMVDHNDSEVSLCS